MPLRPTRFNDGVAYVYRPKERKTDFKAKRNAWAYEDMDLVAVLDFQESSRRQQDLEFAEQAGFSLTMKIRTRFIPGIDNKCKVVIKDYLYDIRYTDKTALEMFLYMEGVGPIAQ